MGGETVEEMQRGVYVKNAKGGDDDDTTGSVTVERKCGGPGLSSGFNGTSRHVRERTTAGDEMLRSPDESQGQKADPETHASGIPSINCPVAGLMVHDAERKEKGGADEEREDFANEKPDEKNVKNRRNVY